MFGFGLCWYGPYQYYWYNLLDYFMPLKNTANFLTKVSEGCMSDPLLSAQRAHAVSTRLLATLQLTAADTPTVGHHLYKTAAPGCTPGTLLQQHITSGEHSSTPGCCLCDAGRCMQVTLNQLALAPVTLAAVFTWNLGLTGQSDAILGKIQRDLVPSMINGVCHTLVCV